MRTTDVDTRNAKPVIQVAFIFFFQIQQPFAGTKSKKSKKTPIETSTAIPKLPMLFDDTRGSWALVSCRIEEDNDFVSTVRLLLICSNISCNSSEVMFVLFL
jgi:hypothetical protein